MTRSCWNNISARLIRTRMGRSISLNLSRDYRWYNEGTCQSDLSVRETHPIPLTCSVMFKAYDTDGNGELSPQEVYNMLQSTSRSRGQTISHEKLLQMVANCFEKVDVNHDGVINFEVTASPPCLLM